MKGIVAPHTLSQKKFFFEGFAGIRFSHSAYEHASSSAVPATRMSAKTIFATARTCDHARFLWAQLKYLRV
jgi:hypothetical protein